MRKPITALAVAVLAGITGLGLVAPSVAAAVPVPSTVAPKVFTLTSSPTRPVYSQTVKLAVTLTPKGGGVPRGGTVTFLLDDTPIGTAVATKRITTLTTTITAAPGRRRLSATYSGDAVIAPSETSLADDYRISDAPTETTVVATRGTVTIGERAEVKATVRPTAPAARTGRPTGQVWFMATGCGEPRAAVVNLNTTAVATWRPLFPCTGTWTVEATYGGSELYGDGQAGTTTVTVEEPAPESVVDQENIAEQGENVQIANSDGFVADRAQPFTAGITGQLDAVDLLTAWYDEDGIGEPLHVSIQPLGSDDRPTGEVLGSATLQPEGELPEDVAYTEHHIVLDTPAPVVAGNRYAVVLRMDEGDGFSMWFFPETVSNPPHTEALYRCCDDVATWVAGQPPLWFRTYVIADPT